MKKFIFAMTLFLLASFAHGQAACSVTGPDGYNGPSSPALNFDCRSGVTPPPNCTPPAVLDPATLQCVTPTPPPVTTCSETQVSNTIGGKTLRRQCTVSMNILPSGGSYGGDAQDLGKLLDGTWPTYNYSGYSPTYTIQSGYYISLAFTPTSAGGIQFTANQSYGDGGTISVSTQPGSLSQGSAGYVCGMFRNGTNGIYISTAGGVCTVKVGMTYYLNLADVDVNGNFLCYNGKANSCASSTVSYTIYTSGQ